ncbi:MULTISPECIES: TetR/AcrR family transcriptional regulator [unclassified Nonomuraea]|uniref:TetR/AcrR family transcriptional regulator n=1 Tax=unclassified Nonomuraea TaxID=2593643 RepID=UPI0033EB8BD4
MGGRDRRRTTDGSVSSRMGRPPFADRDAIVAAALEIGLAEFTMTAVAKRLGTSHSTLYGYFRSRDELAAAAVDQAVDTVEWPEPGQDWRAFLAETAWAHWRLYTSHPGLAEEIISLRLTSAALVRRYNRTGVALLGFGFSSQDAALIMDMVAELVVQAFIGAAEGEPGTQTSLGRQRRRRELIEPWLDDYDQRLRPVLAAAVSGPPEAWFERKLDLFLDGAAQRRR